MEPCQRVAVSVRVAPAAARVAVRAAATPAETGAGTAKRQPRGITKPKPVSPALQAVVGVKEIPRTQALKVIWAYIKENNLQVCSRNSFSVFLIFYVNLVCINCYC